MVGSVKDRPRHVVVVNMAKKPNEDNDDKVLVAARQAVMKDRFSVRRGTLLAVRHGIVAAAFEHHVYSIGCWKFCESTEHLSMSMLYLRSFFGEDIGKPSS